MKCPSIRQSLRASAAAVVIVWVNIMLSALVSANTGLFPHASRGAPLPLPREWHSGQKQWAVAARAFSFAIAPATPPCPILADALARYYALTFPDQLFDQLVHYHASTSKDNIPDDMPVLSQLQARLLNHVLIEIINLSSYALSIICKRMYTLLLWTPLR